MLEFLKKQIPRDHIEIGLSDKDISTSNGSIPDWGVFGLSEWPGRACVASTFRLDKSNLKEQFFKAVIHELGHTQGLDHCPDSTCLMADAKGKNTMDQEMNFCKNCRKKLSEKGWKVQ